MSFGCGGGGILCAMSPPHHHPKVWQKNFPMYLKSCLGHLGWWGVWWVPSPHHHPKVWQENFVSSVNIMLWVLGGEWWGWYDVPDPPLPPLSLARNIFWSSKMMFDVLGWWGLWVLWCNLPDTPPPPPPQSWTRKIIYVLKSCLGFGVVVVGVVWCTRPPNHYHPKVWQETFSKF